MYIHVLSIISSSVTKSLQRTERHYTVLPLSFLRLIIAFPDGDRWISSAEPRATGEWRARSAEVEMVSYVLLALARMDRLIEGFPLLKWLSKQRNPKGGYGSTQVGARRICRHWLFV